MENRNLEKAMELYSRLIMGEEVSKSANAYLYEAYAGNAEVYDILDVILKKSNLKLYEYNNALYVTSGGGNRVFGYTNDELKKAIGLRLNKELFLAYFMVFETVTLFYRTSGDLASREYVKAEDIISAVSTDLKAVLSNREDAFLNETEEESFQSIALLWYEMPVTANQEDIASLKAARGSKLGFVKLVFNFLKDQGLFIEAGDKYYASPRFRALVENYYEDCRGRLYELFNGGGEADASH